ncbi:MAG: hypothetical protein M1820_003013 [Bogoriella megaspora]|nr:MAG: hypothetical protein M1820_003013 [Bogoriella megaspora]
MGVVGSCLRTVVNAIGSALMAIVNAVAAVFQAIISGKSRSSLPSFMDTRFFLHPITSASPQWSDARSNWRTPNILPSP